MLNQMFANVAECRALNNDMLHQGSEVLDVCQPSEELLWADSCHGLALLASSGPFLRLGTEVVSASDQVYSGRDSVVRPES